IDERGNYKAIDDQTVQVTIEDPNSARVFTKELPLSSRGTFNGELEISEEAALGSYQITADVAGGESDGSFQVAEYKKPEYKVKVSTPKKFIPAGEKMKFSIDARYFFGAPVANAEVKYFIYRSRYYAWALAEDEEETDEEEGVEDEYSRYYGYGSDMVQESEGKLDARGQLDVELQIPELDENDPWDYNYRLEVQVTDSSRRTIDGSASFVATRGATIARANPDRYVYTKGEVARINVATTDYEGRPVSAKIQLQFFERTWTKVEKEYAPGQTYTDYEMHEREISSKVLETDSHGTATYNFLTSEAGNVSIKTVLNEGGKQIKSVGGYLWITDSQQKWSE
ncbi:MAG: MG2 domain-containing protein, partial [Burkholderiales bacterium]